MTQDRKERDAAIDGFLESAGWGGVARAPLADDASFRRYERVQDGFRRAVLMDAPPEKEDVRPFVTIAGQLAKVDLSAPEILASDPDQGFLLLEDLGDDTFTRVLAQGGDEKTLYAHGMEALVMLHRRHDDTNNIPDYDDALFVREAALLTDWYAPAVLPMFDPAEMETFKALWPPLLDIARRVPSTLVLRDYHVDNLIWLPDRSSPRNVGLLDFQDAVSGPITYDIASLFEDARRDVDQAMAATMLDAYCDRFPELDRKAFRTSYHIMAVQRSLKIIGIFTRLAHRDNKPDYLRHIPRCWHWVDQGLAEPALAPLKDWLDRVMPPDARRAPGMAT